MYSAADISILKGIHPGPALERVLKKRQLSVDQFAISVGEDPDMFNLILTGKCNLTTPLALKIEHLLGIEEGFFMTLQIYHEIREEKRRQSKEMGTPDLSTIRPALFWDTDINTIDWQFHRRAVIQRVFERGSDREKNEIIRFYGENVVKQYVEL